MADLVTVTGGSKQGISSLTQAEHQAAIHALSKLSAASGATHGVASALGATLRSATLSGGSVEKAGADTFAGGVRSSSLHTIGSDTVVAGSAFSAKSVAATPASGAAHLTADTINVAGRTAAGVKTEAAHTSTEGHTITLSDKTTITLTGVTPHTVTKPH
jgi:hypothetical protein